MDTDFIDATDVFINTLSKLTIALAGVHHKPERKK
jgi:hypothetical protein